MRAFTKGEPFMSVPCEGWIPNEEDIAEMQVDLDDIPRSEFPVFSEAYLYPRLGKEDARFVLGVAEEYDAVIKALGPERVRAILEGDPSATSSAYESASATGWKIGDDGDPYQVDGGEGG